MSERPIIVWLRRDLRLTDHAALDASAASGAPVVPVYVLDDETPSEWRLGGASRWWLAGSLRALDAALRRRGSRLILRRGETGAVLLEVAREIGAAAVYFTRAISHAAEADTAKQRGAAAYIRELYWREFSSHLLFHRPDLPEKPFRPEFAALPWKPDPAALTAWQTGHTGYPIVDAGLRQLWAIGWMHNRVRMVAASFLTKHLLIPWQQGEAWFWDTLIDADLANNAASWQWVAGSGADAAPYFRVFNPILQGLKFDSAGDYVRRWIPESADLPAEHIHAPWDAPDDVLRRAGIVLGETYPRPIIAHDEGRRQALAAYAAVKASSQDGS